MILGTLFLLGAAVLVVLAARALRSARSGTWVRDAQTRIVVEVASGQDAPRLRLVSGSAVLFGPFAAEWAPRAAVSEAFGNPQALPGQAGGTAQTGSWRVVALVDLAAPGAFETGDASLDQRLAASLGGRAMLLERIGGGAAPMLLHGVDSHADGSLGGIALKAEHFAGLVGRVGNPDGLTVEVIRRRIQRAGWGGERAQRRRAG